MVLDQQNNKVNNKIKIHWYLINNIFSHIHKFFEFPYWSWSHWSMSMALRGVAPRGEGRGPLNGRGQSGGALMGVANQWVRPHQGAWCPLNGRGPLTDVFELLLSGGKMSFFFLFLWSLFFHINPVFIFLYCLQFLFFCWVKAFPLTGFFFSKSNPVFLIMKPLFFVYKQILFFW